MSPDEQRRVKELVHKAKDALLDALREAEAAGAPKKLCSALDTLCGRAETLENKL